MMEQETDQLFNTPLAGSCNAEITVVRSGADLNWPADKVDIEQLCRACANANDCLIPIFEGEGLEHNLPMKVKKYLPVKVDENDCLPKNMCYHCASTLIGWHDLVVGCVEAEKKLNSLRDSSITQLQSNEFFESEPVVIGAVDTNNSAKCEDSSSSNKVLKPNDNKLNDGSNLEKLTVNKNSIAEESFAESDALSNERVSSCKTLNDYRRKIQAFLKNENKELNPLAVGADLQKHDQFSFKEFMMQLKQINPKASTFIIKINPSENYSDDRTDFEYLGKSINKTSDGSKSISRPVKNRNVKYTADGYMCRCCGQRSTYLAELLDHLKVCENKTKAEVKEALDDKFEGNESAEELEKDEVSGERTKRIEHEAYRCNECNMMFKWKGNYKVHLRKHTGERPYVCNDCGKTFSMKGSFNYHVKHVHMGIKDHVCDICGRKFSTKEGVVEHIRTHTGERPHVCHFCGKTFKTISALYSHKLTHSDEFPYACNICNMKFKFRSSLNAHILIHTGERKHICEVCQKSFRLRKGLSRHKQTHSFDKHYLCSLCPEIFAVKRYLNRHMKYRHNLKYVDEKCVI